MAHHYTRAELADAFRSVGMHAGDVVFSHSNVGFFGIPEGGSSKEVVEATVLGAFFDVLGPTGTLVVPTFTYSFCRRLPFDPDETPSTCGLFTEWVRRRPEAVRSHDPIFSVAAIGPQAEALTADLPDECFGPDSFWDRFRQAGGLICNLNLDAGSTYLHYVERMLRVPYRYDKAFPGVIRCRGDERRHTAIYFVQDLSNADTVAAFEHFDALSRQAGVTRTARVGRGGVVALRAQAAFDLVAATLPGRPWLLTAAESRGVVPVLENDEASRRLQVSLAVPLAANAAGRALGPLPREVVGDGLDATVASLAAALPLTVHAFPAGSRGPGWIVPEKRLADGRHAFSSLKVAEWFLPGSRPETLHLWANLGPVGDGDGLAGALAALEVWQGLAARPERRFGYRLVLVPGDLGIAAFLQRFGDRLPPLAGSLWLGPFPQGGLRFSCRDDDPLGRLLAVAVERTGQVAERTAGPVPAAAGLSWLEAAGIPTAALWRCPGPDKGPDGETALAALLAGVIEGVEHGGPR